MLKKTCLRVLLGFPLGVFLGYSITILISLVNGDGSYSAAVPSLVDEMGGEAGAVVLQYLLSGVLGAAFAAGSVVWETDWSIVKQTLSHFAVSVCALFPVAWFARWMEHSPSGVLLYVGSFVLAYGVIWLVQYLFWKGRIRQINLRLKG